MQKKQPKKNKNNQDKPKTKEQEKLRARDLKAALDVKGGRTKGVVEGLCVETG